VRRLTQTFYELGLRARWVGVSSPFALWRFSASVQANRQTLLETELGQVVTKSGKQIPTSQFFKARQSVDTFAMPSDPRLNFKFPSKWQVM